MLKFLGRGSAFSDEHNSAYFVAGDDLVLLDCSMTSFMKLCNKNLAPYDRVYLLVTHTHGDHVRYRSVYRPFGILGKDAYHGCCSF